MIARVRGVSAFAAASGSRLRVAKSMSAKTGFAPTDRIAQAVAMNVNGGALMSSPRQGEPLRARVHGDGVRHAAPCRELRLEGADLGSEGVRAGVEHAPERSLELAAERLVLGSQVVEGNHASTLPGVDQEGGDRVAAAGLEPATLGL